MGSKGLKGFDAYYSQLFGERWERLRAALAAPARQVSRINAFADPSHLAARFPRSEHEGRADLRWVPGSGLEPETDAAGLLDSYKMDLASVFPALALAVRPGDRVLDMCAAPGGKALILAEALWNRDERGDGELIVNEISDNRRARLKRVLREYLPDPVLARTRVTGHDAARWCMHEKNAYDRILLDAPCSGERHLIEDAGEMRTWSEARSKNLSVRQHALLASAVQALKPGGRVVYSTCSLSVRENDDVIERLLKRRPGEVRALSGRSARAEEDAYSPPIGEPTGRGWMILPDVTGHGPIYFSILERNSAGTGVD